MSRNQLTYQIIPASQDVGNMFDEDNFYESDLSNFDGVMDESDVEFSDAFGDKLRSAYDKVKSAVQRRSADERETSVGTRLDAREDRTRSRGYKKSMRRASRERRRNMRQVNRWRLLGSRQKTATEQIVQKNPETREAVEKTKEGLADDLQEKLANDVFTAAEQMVQTGSGVPDLNVDMTTGEATPKYWSTLSTGAKVGIIGGGVVALGLIVFAIVKASKK